MKVNIGPYSDKKRKIQVKIDDHDLFNVDLTLAILIHPLLKKLNKVRGGAPNVSDEDVPEHLHSPTRNEYEPDPHYFDKWNWVLNEMTWTFKQIKKDVTTFKNTERIDNGLRLFGKYYRGLWT